MAAVPNRAPKRDYQVERAGTNFSPVSSKKYEATDYTNGSIYPGVTAAHAEKRLKNARAVTSKNFKILDKNPDVKAAALGQKGESTAYVIDGMKYRKSAVDAVRSGYNKAGTKVRKSGK